MAEDGGRDAVPGFGDRVRELREAKGLTQVALAEQAGTHFTTVSKVEKGERNASLQLALKLADALGVALTKLVPADWKERLARLQGDQPKEEVVKPRKRKEGTQ
jgi:transcriptional regulator with XRE-family HTH domain